MKDISNNNLTPVEFYSEHQLNGLKVVRVGYLRVDGLFSYDRVLKAEDAMEYIEKLQMSSKQPVYFTPVSEDVRYNVTSSENGPNVTVDSECVTDADTFDTDSTLIISNYEKIKKLTGKERFTLEKYEQNGNQLWFAMLGDDSTELVL